MIDSPSMSVRVCLEIRRKSDKKVLNCGPYPPKLSITNGINSAPMSWHSVWYLMFLILSLSSAAASCLCAALITMLGLSGCVTDTSKKILRPSINHSKSGRLDARQK